MEKKGRVYQTKDTNCLKMNGQPDLKIMRVRKCIIMKPKRV